MRQTMQRQLPPMEVNRVHRDRLTTGNDVNRERDWLELVPRAMGRAGLSYKAMASDLGVSVPLLSAQLAGVPDKHFSFRRLWKTSPEFMRELVLLVVEFYGIQLAVSDQERRDMELGRTVREAMQRRLA